MEELLAVVIDCETKAQEAVCVLRQLGNISIFALAVIRKNADGTVTITESGREFPVRLVAGMGIGAFIGLLRGPIGAAGGAAAVGLGGLIRDLYVAGVDEEFVAEVSANLTPGKFAVVADVSEDGVTPLDTQMERFGGTVFRTSKKSVEEAERTSRKVAKLRAQISALNAEQARTQGEYKAKLQAGVDKLNAELEDQLSELGQRLDQVRSEAELKVGTLQKKAEGAPEDVRASIDAEVKRIRQDYDETEAVMRHALAERLRETAERVDNQLALTQR